MSLPVLDPRFFTANKPSANFFQKWKEQGTWNEGILPIYEWDGFVYIALDHAFYAQHEPETLHAQFPFPHVLLFAPSAELKKIWSDYHHVAPVPTEMPATKPAAIGEQIFDMDAIAKATGTSLEPEFATTEPVAVADEIPEGLQIQNSTMPPKTQSSSIENDDPFSSLTKAPVKQTSEETVFDAALDLTQISNPSIPNLQIKQAAPAPTPSATTPHVATPAEKTAVSRTKAPLQSSDWADSFFDKLNSHFPYSLIFLVNKNQAIPLKWTANLQAKNPSYVDISRPSPFYVVNRTQQSYHGPVAESAEMRKFCQEWQLKNYPQHMTASPIKINDQLIGILIAIGEPEHYQNSLLQLCESCAGEIAELIRSQPQILKAA